MAGGKRVEGAEAARFAAVYGLGNSALSYDQFVQLYLNTDVALAIHGFYDAVAALVATGESLPDDWLKAAIESPAEISRWRRWDLKRTLKR